jgi:hypothetical protein
MQKMHLKFTKKCKKRIIFGCIFLQQKLQKSHKKMPKMIHRGNPEIAKTEIAKITKNAKKWYVGENRFIAGIFTILVTPDNQLSSYWLSPILSRFFGIGYRA